MKSLFFSFALFVSCIYSTYAQWYPQNSGTNEEFWHVNFVSENIGWASSNYKIYKTTDGGNNWFVQKDSYPERIIKFQFLNEYTGWYMGTYTGMETNIHKTIDGGNTWNLMDSIIDTYLQDIKFIDGNVGWCVGEGGIPGYWIPAAFRTTDGGTSWEYISVSPTYFILFSSVDFINELEGWISGVDLIFKTTDGGNNWIELPYLFGSTYAIKMQFLNSNIGWSVTDGYGLYRTTDGGNSWGSQLTQGYDFYFYSMQNGWKLFDSTIYNSTDGGETWTAQNINNNQYLLSISFVDANKGWAVGDSGVVYHTINGGTPVEFTSFNFTQIHNDVELVWTTGTETNNKGFVIEKKQSSNQWENIGFIQGNGTSTIPHAYFYTDNNLSPGIYNYRLKQIDFDGKHNYSKEIEVEIFSPHKFSLEQNYPNPFNPVTTIEYSIPEEFSNTLVTLKIFNNLGEEIIALVNENKPAGNYSVKFDGSKLPSGIYIYRLIGGNYSMAKKLILMK